MLYEVVIIQKEKRDKDGEIKEDEKLISDGVENFLVKDAKSAALKATIKYSEKLSEADAERVEVHVRPFA